MLSSCATECLNIYADVNLKGLFFEELYNTSCIQEIPNLARTGKSEKSSEKALKERFLREIQDLTIQ